MKFMVTIRFRAEDRTAIEALIPHERAQIKALSEQGVVTSIYIAAAGSPVWLVMQAESQEKAQQSLQTLPLFPYMEAEFATLL